ncbi:MAG: TrkH family potassium uptake protein [Bacteroidales bacterium]|nr:TrkH family potassium uptake protein [Candidatus Latescibacterota bacterium]
MRVFTSIQRMRPGLLVIISFTLAAVIGAILLALPAASVGDPLSAVDALFTATSAVCVTGLVVVETGSHFTMFGKSVILALIQLGGLGLMTFSVFLFLFLGKGLGTRQRWIMTETFTPAPIKKIRKLIRSIFVFTFVAEGIGAASLFFFWYREMPFKQALYHSVFHSVSAFCNAGFSTYRESFVQYQGDVWLNMTIMVLIVAGGIGFPVIYELRNRLFNRNVKRRPAVSLHTKMVIATTVILVLAGWSLILLSESKGEISSISIKDKLLTTLFQSVTARTAGFNTLDISRLAPGTLFMLVMLMFVGASPGSCGGGIKTTSLAVFMAIFKSKIAGRRNMSLFKRTIPDDVISRALAVFILAVLVVTAGLISLLITEMTTNHAGNEYFLSYLFEAVSAFGTVGLSMGITSSLTEAGKLVIIMLMMVGRVGLLTVAYVVTRAEHGRPFKYAGEKVMVG